MKSFLPYGENYPPLQQQQQPESSSNIECMSLFFTNYYLSLMQQSTQNSNQIDSDSNSNSFEQLPEIPYFVPVFNPLDMKMDSCPEKQDFTDTFGIQSQSYNLAEKDDDMVIKEKEPTNNNKIYRPIPQNVTKKIQKQKKNRDNHCSEPQTNFENKAQQVVSPSQVLQLMCNTPKDLQEEEQKKIKQQEIVNQNDLNSYEDKENIRENVNNNEKKLPNILIPKNMPAQNSQEEFNSPKKIEDENQESQKQTSEQEKQQDSPTNKTPIRRKRNSLKYKKKRRHQQRWSPEKYQDQNLLNNLCGSGIAFNHTKNGKQADSFFTFSLDFAKMTMLTRVSKKYAKKQFQLEKLLYFVNEDYTKIDFEYEVNGEIECYELVGIQEPQNVKLLLKGFDIIQQRLEWELNKNELNTFEEEC